MTECEPALAASMRDLLELLGYAPVVTDEPFLLLRSGAVDAAIVDARRARSLGVFDDLAPRIVVTTSEPVTPEEVGAAVVEKPYTLRDLVAALARATCAGHLRAGASLERASP